MGGASPARSWMEPSANPAGWLLPLVNLRSVEIDGLRTCSAARAGARKARRRLVLMSIGGLTSEHLG
jgi:hypothetical protein